MYVKSYFEAEAKSQSIKVVEELPRMKLLVQEPQISCSNFEGCGIREYKKAFAELPNLRMPFYRHFVSFFLFHNLPVSYSLKSQLSMDFLLFCTGQAFSFLPRNPYFSAFFRLQSIRGQKSGQAKFPSNGA